MLAVGIILGIILYVVMMSMMIIFERDKPKNIIIWSMVFLATQVVGFVIYILIRIVFYKKKRTFITKQSEDQIYHDIISKNLFENGAHLNHDVLNFNEMAFNSKVTVNNHYEIFTETKEFKDNLYKDIEKAKHYILFEVTRVNSKDFGEIKKLLIKKASNNLTIKFIYDRPIKHSLKKELKAAGIRVYKYSKFNTVGKVYANLRNSIIIDGEIAYLSNLNISNNQLASTKEKANLFMRLKGDIVQNIDVAMHQDIVFASGKHLDYTKRAKVELSNEIHLQYITNNIEQNIELALIKAICSAEKSVQLQLSQFIPTESIMSLLRFAINSNIDVKLMVPLKNDRRGKYFASRAYAKELALMGANVYLYDGFINYNAITVDDEYVIYGSFIVDREHITTSPQNMLFIKDNKAVKKFKTIFDVCVDNSYRINNAKFMLMRERFFKNFV